MKPLYIFDLDGTLALIEHRRHFVERPSRKCSDCGGANRKNCVQCSDLDAGWSPNWPAFYLACVRDNPNTPVIDTMSMLRGNATVWIFSGRSDEVRAETLRWLADHCAWIESNGKVLRMRKAGNYTPDDVLKKQWLDEMSADDRARLVAVFEDRDRMVKMWRANGIPCFQVDEGNF